MAIRQFSIGREFERAKAGEGDLVVAMAFASNAPYERWWGVEILECEPENVRLGRLNDGAPLLYNHRESEHLGTHVSGSIRAGEGKLRGKVRITSVTQAGRDAIGLVETGVLSKASVGYHIYKIVQQTTAKQADGSTARVEREIDGVVFERLLEQHGFTRDGVPSGRGDLVEFRRAIDATFINDVRPLMRASDDEPDVYRVVDWEPYENSLVTIPADNGVGVGRSAAVGADQQLQQLMSRTIAREVANARQLEREAAERTQTISQPAATTANQGATTMGDQIVAAGNAADSANTNDRGAATTGNPAQPRQGPSAMELETERVAAIDNLVRAGGIDAGIRNAWVTSGASMRSISDEYMRILQQRADATPKVTQLGLNTRETRQFSMCRAIEACASQNWSNAGFEAECSSEIQKRLNVAPKPQSFYVPWEIQERANMTPVEHLAYQMMKRDLTVASAGAGGYLVETANVGFIPLLRNKSVMFNMGAMRLSGLQGNVSIPKQSATGSATWLTSESATISEINQTFVQVALSPKNVGGYTEISRQLLLQSNPSAEGIVMSDLATVVALDIDLKGLNGSGASGQPTGILNTAGIGSVTGTSLAYDDIVEFQTDVFAGNALTGASGYVTTGAVAGLLKQRVKFTSTASPMWEGRLEAGAVDGYRAMASNQMPSATMLFGDFGLGVVVAEWGVLEMMVNPFANFQAGIVGVRAIASIDIGVRYPTAFSAAASIT